MKLDRIDHGLLADLQKDARISNKELAAKNKISPSTCLERVRRLRSIGAIRGFHAEVDPKALGIGVQALIGVRLIQHAQVLFDDLREELLRIPEVTAVYMIAGAQDVLIHVAVRDVDHLRTLVGQTLTSRRDIAHLETSLIFEHARKAVWPNYA
ncbi:MAG: AsnC family transcriptional regulator [Gemmatales bacterium]|nr:MAG: AsnC family transcriptional regulator [Gemmatales bacterium]